MHRTTSEANLASNAIGTDLVLNDYDLLTGRSASRELAAFLFTPLAITQLAAVLVAGVLVDRCPHHRVVALPMCATAAACVLVRAGGLGPW